MTLLYRFQSFYLFKSRSILISDKNIFVVDMHPENFKNKFAQYLSKKINSEQRKTLFRGQFQIEEEKQLPSSVYPFSALSHRGRASPNRNSQYGASEPNTIRLTFDESTREKETHEMDIEVEPIQRKRLKKLRQLEQNQCGICLDQIKKQCQLKCKHKFCFPCLQNWFQKSNKCPYCRAQTPSFWYKGNQFLVQPLPQNQQYDESEDSQWGEEPDVDSACYNCQQTKVGDVVLICDNCDVNVCHLKCDETLFGVMPEGQWYCHFCR